MASLWYRRSKGLGFDIAASLRSRITAVVPKPPASIINQNSQLGSKFTSPTWNHQVIASHFRHPIGNGYRCYHVDRLHVKLRPSNHRPSKLILVPTVLVIGGILYYWNVSTYTDRDHFLLLTVNEEKSVGWSEFQKKKDQFQGRIALATDPESVRVKMVLEDILVTLNRSLNGEINGVKLPFSHLEGLNWEVLVVKDDADYACCLPGGKIIVFTGLLERFSTNEELATIIANEVAHVVKRHHAECFTMHFWLAPMRLIMHKFGMPLRVETSVDYYYICMMAIQADYIGLLLMAAAGYDPRVAPKVFEKMDPVSKPGDSAFENYISTHPWGVTRSKVLSDANVMQRAIAIYEGAIARGREVAFIESSLTSKAGTSNCFVWRKLSNLKSRGVISLDPNCMFSANTEEDDDHVSFSCSLLVLGTNLSLAV
ncbi:mitochondrial metalloendopeptidase OMA1-like [Bidens hawaiensis]|uniref:mitochondrial metalloendopeptidase OMA1-like n=1 Tax=Bidens hawaiensis TaxID=980011 RepID=UPI00404B21CC